MADDKKSYTINTQQFPIRMLTNGWLEKNAMRDYEYTNRRNLILEGNGLANLSLTGTFIQVAAPALSTTLFHDSYHCWRLSSDYKYSRIYDESMIAIYNRNPEHLFQIVKTESKEFTNWKKYYNAKDKTFNDAAFAALPPLSKFDYHDDVQGCELTAVLNDETKTIILPVDPHSLFNAIVIAGNTGTALSFTMPKTMDQQGTLTMLRPRRIDPTKPLKIG